MLHMLRGQWSDSRDRQTGTENRAQGQHMLSMFINFCSFSPAGHACFLDVPWILIDLGSLLPVLRHTEMP